VDNVSLDWTTVEEIETKLRQEG